MLLDVLTSRCYATIADPSTQRRQLLGPGEALLRHGILFISLDTNLFLTQSFPNASKAHLRGHEYIIPQTKDARGTVE